MRNLRFNLVLTLWVAALSHCAAQAITTEISNSDCVAGPHPIDVRATYNATAPASFVVRWTTTATASGGKDTTDIVLQVYREWAPRGVDRFYQLIMDNYYDCAAFFRVDPGTNTMTRKRITTTCLEGRHLTLSTPKSFRFLINSLCGSVWHCFQSEYYGKMGLCDPRRSRSATQCKRNGYLCLLGSPFPKHTAIRQSSRQPWPRFVGICSDWQNHIRYGSCGRHCRSRTREFRKWS